MNQSLKSGVEVRLQTAKALFDITVEYRQLDVALTQHSVGLSTKDAALMQAMCYGVMRWYEELIYWLESQAKRSVKDLKPEVRILLLLGLFQLKYMRIPAHAAIHATVECAGLFRAKRAKGLINAVLRGFQRYQSANTDEQQHQALQGQSDVIRYAHPQWMLDKFKADWPAAWQQLVISNNEQAPMVLRVAAQQMSMEDYLMSLESAGITANKHAVANTALVLTNPQDVESLPGFSEGLVSVQDAAAQLAAPLLQHDKTHRVLDACAAPGGKTAHILQIAQPAVITALDNSESRLERVEQVLQRINQTAVVVTGNAANPEEWWDSELYDRVLLDAPCSASGVIRRHPDIKYLRSERTLQKIVKRQAKILAAMWQLLKPGGMLLYVTCSVFKVENEEQIKTFLQSHSDASLADMPVSWGRGEIGRQVLPGDDGMDGFYFALLSKS